MKWPAYSLDLNPIENIWGNIQHYLGSRTFSSISSLKKEIEDKWNKFDHELCRRLIDSVKRRTNIWISLEGALTVYQSIFYFKKVFYQQISGGRIFFVGGLNFVSTTVSGVIWERVLYSQ